MHPEGLQTRLAPQTGTVLAFITHRAYAESPRHVMMLTEWVWVVTQDCDTCWKIRAEKNFALCPGNILLDIKCVTGGQR